MTFRAGVLVLLAAIVDACCGVWLAWHGHQVTAVMLVVIALGASLAVFVFTLKGTDW